MRARLDRICRMAAIFVAFLLLLCPATHRPTYGQLPPTEIAAGDSVDVTVYREADLSRTYTVSPENMVSFPLIGQKKVGGMTVEQLSEMLTREYSQYLRNPQITVNFGKTPFNKVYVTGQVHEPGSYPWTKGLRVTDYLGAAGGVIPGARLQDAVIRREEAGKVRQINIDLRKVLFEGDPNHNIELKPGDTLFVPLGAFKVYVNGEVKNPGAYDYLGGMRLTDALGLAGGPTQGADTTRVRITRAGSTRSESFTVNADLALRKGDVSQNPPLLSGDVIHVPAAAKVYVVGEVQRPGAFDYQEGFRVRHYLALAGGPTNEADVKKATLTTTRNGSPVSLTFNLQEALAKANSDQNLEVNIGDSIYVPRKVDRVYVTGQVVHPGDFEVREGFRVTDYVGLAGGPTPEAKLSGSTVIRYVDGKPVATRVDLAKLMRGQDLEHNYILKPGDTITVGQKFMTHRVQDYSAVAQVITSLAVLLRLVF